MGSTVNIWSNAYLTGLVDRIVPRGEFWYPSIFGAGANGENIDESQSNEVFKNILTGERTVLNYTDADGQATMGKKVKRGKVSLTLPTIRAKINLTASDLAWTLNPGTQREKWRAESRLQQELQHLVEQAERRHELTAWDILKDGAANFPIEVNGAVVNMPVDFQMAAANIIDNSGTPWSTVGTNIIADLAAAQKVASQKSIWGPLTDAYCSEAVIGYILANDFAQAVMNEDTKRGTFEDGPTGRSWRFQNINWHPVTHYYDSDGAGTLLHTVNQHATEEFIVFKTSGPAGEMVRGPAPDTKAGQRAIRFTKTYETEDPSAVWLLVCETMAPMMTYPDDVVSMQVT